MTTESELQARGLVVPETLKGFQDLLPASMIARNRIISTVAEVYERYGFVPLDTPILEHLSTLIGTGGEETNKQLFQLETPEGHAAAMRFDLTVGFARIIAQYTQEVQLPFRRYHIGPVFRADKPGPGRFRQFTQFDVDAAGSDSVAVDAEIVAVMCEAMRALGLRGGLEGRTTFQLRMNNRKLVDALLEGRGIHDTQTQKHVLRVVDKLAKVGVSAVAEELGPGRVDESGDTIPGVGLSRKTIDTILEFIQSTAPSRGKVADSLAPLLGDSAEANAALLDMQHLASALESLGVGEDEAVFDPSLARGLDYYTGPVFEVILPGAMHVGSVVGGGRYDGLVERFSTTQVPATGASIGLDRLVEGLRHLSLVDTSATTVQVLVVSMPEVTTELLLEVATELRRSGIRTEVYFGQPNTGMAAQLAFANGRGIPVAAIIGRSEAADGTVSIKDLVEGKERRAGIDERSAYVAAGTVGQVTVPRKDLVPTVRRMLGE